MRLALLLFVAGCAAKAQFFPFPGPGTIAHSGSGPQTPAFVQGNICEISTTGTNTTCAFGSSVTTNNLLVAIGRWDDAASGSPYTATFTSSSGVSCTWNTAIAKFRSGSSNQGVQMMYCVAPSGGAETVQMALNSANSTFKDLVILEYSGVAASSPLDVTNFNAGPDAAHRTTACSSNTTATLSTTGDLAIGFCTMWDNSNGSWGVVSGFTNRPTGSNIVFGTYDGNRATTTGVTFAITLPAVDQWTAGIATFKPGP